MENKTLIEKASMTLADLATGGKLNPDQFNAFYQKLLTQPTLLSQARTVQMHADAMKIEKLGFGARILRAGAEGVAATEGQRVKPTASTVQLNAKEVTAEVRLSYDTIESNIEGAGLQDTIINMLAKAAARDIEELIINGDTASGDAYLALLDGLMKQASAHVVDFASVALDRSVFKKAIAALPSQYMNNPADLRFFANPVAAIEYADQVVTRQTALGDKALEGGLVSAFGVPVVGNANIKQYVDATNNVSDILLTNPQNIVVGFSRNVSIEVDKDISARQFIIVLTAKVDSKFEEADAVVKVTKVKA
jgi:hypothetical protein